MEFSWQNIGMGIHFLLQGIFPTQGLNPGFIHWQAESSPSEPAGKPFHGKYRFILTILCWERLKARGEGDDRGWDGWMASLTQWTWVWVNSGSWRWTGRSGVLQSMGSQRVGYNGVTELTELNNFLPMKSKPPCFAHLGAQQFELKVFCSKGKQSWINAPFTLVDFHFFFFF